MSKKKSNIDSLSGREFENVIEKLIIKMGFHVEERKKGADQGIDIIAINEQPLFKGTYVIQCKRYSKPVGEPVLRDLFGVVHSRNANKGILITNSTFTKQAIEFSKDKQIELIDGSKLAQLLLEYEIFEPDKIIFHFPNGVRVFQSSFITPLEKMISEIEDYRNGLIYVNKKDIDEPKLWDILEDEMNRRTDYTQTITNIVNNIAPLLNSSSNEDMNTVRTYSRYILEANKAVLTRYKKMYSYIPSERLFDSHKNWLKVLETIFDDWKIHKEKLVSSMENPPEDGNITFELIFSGAAMEDFSISFNKAIASFPTFTPLTLDDSPSWWEWAVWGIVIGVVAWFLVHLFS